MINRIEAVAEAMTWCLIWGHEPETLELNHDELHSLITNKGTESLTSTMLTPIAGHYKLFGVKIQFAEFPRKSMIRTRYLQLTNSPTWIEWLAQDMEQYA